MEEKKGPDDKSQAEGDDTSYSSLTERERRDAERIAYLEKRVEELEKSSKKSRNDESDIQVQGIVEGVVGQFIPGLGGIIKALESSSPEFRQRIAETDAEIRHKIDVGWSTKPVVDYHVSTRPLGGSRGRAGSRHRSVESVRMPASAPNREPIIDVLESKEGITVIAELPGVSEDDLNVNLHKETLEILAGSFSKRIILPSSGLSIQTKSYKNGILQVKLSQGG